MIVDSGNRTEFESGAVRDIQEGKGRCDLLPLDVASAMFAEVRGGDIAVILNDIAEFQNGGGVGCLLEAIAWFRDMASYRGVADMLLEVAVHFEEGAQKYGERNWQKGMPVKRYIDSGVRHYMKWLRGDSDERHDRAFVWNMMCAIWTCIHHPEMNEYKKAEEVPGDDL